MVLSSKNGSCREPEQALRPRLPDYPPARPVGIGQCTHSDEVDENAHLSSLFFLGCNSWLSLKFTYESGKMCMKKRQEENIPKYRAWLFTVMEMWAITLSLAPHRGLCSWSCSSCPSHELRPRRLCWNSWSPPPSLQLGFLPMRESPCSWSELVFCYRTNND